MHVVVKTIIRKLHVVVWQTQSKYSTRVPGGRAARLLSLIKQIRLFSGVVFAVAIVFALVLSRREGASLLFSPIRPRSTHHYQCDVT